MALRLIEKIIKKFNLQPQDILLTITTQTAKNYAKQFHKDTYILPLDYYFITKNTIKKIKPQVLIILETELWPNLIYFANKFKSKIFLLNGRISKRTFVFFKVFKFLFFNIINKIDYFLVREDVDFLRFKNLGINKQKIKITGNMKYDDIEIDINLNFTKKSFGFSEDDFIITFGSIREREEKEVLKVIRYFKHKDNIKFILAPRHLELLQKIIFLLEKESIAYNFLSSQNFSSGYKCLVIDRYGQLNKLYFISDIVFVCGSILPYGGHNIIEPAILGKPVFFGPYISSFLEPARILLKNNAAVQVKNMEEFIKKLEEIIGNTQLILEYGRKARAAMMKLKGVTEKNLDFIGQYIEV